MVQSMKWVVVVGVVVCFATVLVIESPAQSTLLSENKPCFANSWLGEYVPSMANDGIIEGGDDNKWVTSGNAPHWWYVDLEAEHHVTSAWITGYGYPSGGSRMGFNPRRVGIYGSNTATGAADMPANWTWLTEFDFFGSNSPMENCITFSGHFRYVGFYFYRPVCVDPDITQIREIQVYGYGPPDPPPRGSNKPTSVTVLPNSGSWQVGTTKTFTVTVDDPDGCTNTRLVFLGIGDDFGKRDKRLLVLAKDPLNTSHAAHRILGLYNGATGWLSQYAFPGTTNMDNGEVILVNSGCSAGCDDTRLIVSFEIMLQSTYSDLGQKNIYVQTIDRPLTFADDTCNIITTQVGSITIEPPGGTPTPTPPPWHHFAWDDLPASQQVGVPFPVRITARDYNHTPVPYYDDTVGLRACTGTGRPLTIGEAPAQTASLVLNTNHTKYRCQTIFHASQVEQPGEISRLGLVFTHVPYTRMFDLTVRMRHTTLSEYGSSPVWESTDWFTVLQADMDIVVDIPPGGANWFNFYFQQPFLYNGVDNLMVDISFSNPSTASPGYTLYNTDSAYRTITGYSTAHGEPTSWSGTAPAPNPSVDWPIIRLTICEEVAISPTESGIFQSGVWQGDITVQEYAPIIHLVSVDPFGFFDRSEPFELTPHPNYTPPATNTPGPTLAPTNTPIVTEFVVDNTDAGFQTSGEWSLATAATDKYGADYYWAESGASTSTASWSINIANPASVQVYAWWSQGGNRADNAPYTITHAGRRESTTVRVNQQANGGQWNSLGTFNFNAGAVTVTLSNDANPSVVIADAVRFVVAQTQPTPTNTPVVVPTDTPIIVPTNTPVSDFCMGDADRNGFVNSEDFRSVRDNFGKGECGVGDANNDCFVNSEDFRAVRDNFGRACP